MGEFGDQRGQGAEALAEGAGLEEGEELGGREVELADNVGEVEAAGQEGGEESGAGVLGGHGAKVHGRLVDSRG